MAIVNEVKCARCDRKYSGVRSRCPYCGARRIGRGKYSEDSDNARGKMLISVLIMAVFTVAAGILLFSAPAVDAEAQDSSDDSTISSPEDEIVEVPGVHPEPTPPPTLPPEPDEPELPMEVTSVQIWVGTSHRTEDFTLQRGESIELRARLEPPGIEDHVEEMWESTNPEVFDFVTVVGGIRVTGITRGDAQLILRAGDKETFTWVRVRD